MARWRVSLGLCALLFLAGNVILRGQPPTLSCSVQPVPQTLIRGEGVAELTGDVGVLCGAASPAIGTPIPLYNITVTLNCPLASRIFANHISEALLIIDEAYPAQPNPTSAPRWPTSGSPQNLCGAVGGTNCEIVETGLASGDPGGDYDGSAGHYNVFEGIQSAFNSVSFLGVPLSGSVSLRITNLRADASALLVPPFTSVPVEAFLSGSLGISGESAVVATAQRTLAVTQTPPTPVAGTSNTAVSVTFAEIYGFPEAFKTWTTKGGPQNVPGGPYQNAESGLWDKLKPPSGIGAVGMANHGTRLMVHFTGYPPGVNITGPSAEYLTVPSGKTATNTGAVLYVATDANGNSASGPALPSAPTVTVTTDAEGNAWLTYEVVVSDGTASESVTIPVTIGSTSAGTVTGSYGPLAAPGTTPIPRFIEEQ